jgi:hypothetical protein
LTDFTSLISRFHAVAARLITDVAFVADAGEGEFKRDGYGGFIISCSPKNPGFIDFPRPVT